MKVADINYAVIYFPQGALVLVDFLSFLTACRLFLCRTCPYAKGTTRGLLHFCVGIVTFMASICLLPPMISLIVSSSLFQLLQSAPSSMRTLMIQVRLRKQQGGCGWPNVLHWPSQRLILPSQKPCQSCFPAERPLLELRSRRQLA